MKKLFILPALILTLLLSNCKKEEDIHTGMYFHLMTVTYTNGTKGNVTYVSALNDFPEINPETKCLVGKTSRGNIACEVVSFTDEWQEIIHYADNRLEPKQK